MLDAYLDNATAMWSAVATNSSVDRGIFRAETPRVARIVLREPASADVVSSLLDGLPRTKATVVENVFGTGRVEPSDPAVRVMDMPVMLRSAGSLQAGSGSAAKIVRVSDAGELATAERTIVEGFPVPALHPWRRGQALPARVLTVPGWCVWLAYLQDRPAAAGYTVDDGRAVGVYWLATLPSYRSAGLGRAVMTHAIQAFPDRLFVLTATDAGRPLYESMGFRTLATARWYLRSAEEPNAATN